MTGTHRWGKGAIGAAVALVSCAAASLALFQTSGGSASVVHESNAWTHEVPPAVTDEQLSQFHDAILNDTPLPPGFQETSKQGKVRAVLTGVETQSPPEQMLSVTVIDDTPDLNQAWLYVDSQLLFHATRANGSIVDRSDHSIAMLNGFIPKYGAFSVRVEWEGASGVFVAEDAISGL